MKDILAILEEGNLLHPGCTKYDMFVPQRSLEGRHSTTDICRRGEERKCLRLAAEEARAGVKIDLITYGNPFMAVSYFKYLGRVLSDS